MLRERREEGKEIIGIIRSSRSNPNPPEVSIPFVSFLWDWLRTKRKSRSKATVRRPVL